MNHRRNIKITLTIQKSINQNTQNHQRHAYIIKCIKELSLKLRKLIYEPLPKYILNCIYQNPQKTNRSNQTNKTFKPNEQNVQTKRTGETQR